MTQPSAYRFRVDIAPDWAVLADAVQRRAEQIGIGWPHGLKPHQVPRVYSARLVGTQRPETGLSYEVIAWEPPKEVTLPGAGTAWESLHLSFGVVKRRFVGPRDELPRGALAPLAVHLDAKGLYLPPWQEGGEREPLVDAPLPEILRQFYQVATGVTSLRSAGVDHIVNKYVSMPPLEHFAISRWRGDATHRLTTQGLRLEILVDERLDG